MKRNNSQSYIANRITNFLLANLSILFFFGSLSAQTFITRSQEIRMGFHAGRGGYFGEYNPSMFGSPFVYGFEENSPQKQNLFTENMFGGYLKLPLNSTFGVLIRGDFGNLGYDDPGLNHVMSISYRNFAGAIEINPFHAFLVQPYLTLGAGLMRYELPPPIPDLDLAQYSTGNFGDKAQALYFPVTLGVSYAVSDRTAFFAEFAFNSTNADNLDNLSLPGSVQSSSLSNDGFASIRVGINVAFLKFFSLKRNKKSVRRPVYPEAAVAEALTVETEQIRPIKLLNADTLKMYVDAMNAEREKLLVKGEPTAKKPEDKPLKAAPGLIPVGAAVAAVVPVAPVIPKKIPVAKPPEERVFKQEAQKEVVKEVQADRSRARAEARAAEEARIKEADASIEQGESPAPQITARPTAKPLTDKRELKNIADRSDPTLYTDETDPFIPKLFIKPRAIPEEIMVDGFVTRDPPVGYYVQVYATVGPISAQRARQNTINLLKNVLEDAESQVIITQRRQFYEVRIGVFDTYDDTIQILEQVLGTYFDAYSLIYLTDNL